MRPDLPAPVPDPVPDLVPGPVPLPVPVRRHTVSVLALDGLSPFELSSVVEVFGLPRPELDIPWYDLRVCSTEPGRPLRVVGGFTLTPEHGMDVFATADTVIVPHMPNVKSEAPVPGEVVDALRSAHAHGA
ncbi:hypothetical protein ACFQ07_10480, partial [Actinomadura adrarensis]